MNRSIPLFISSMMLLQGCASRVALQGVSKTASEEERVAAYRRLRPAQHSFDIAVVSSDAGIRITSSDSVILAEGSKIVHPGDFSPILSEDTVAAKRIAEFESASESSTVWGGLFLLTSAVGLGLMWASIDDQGNNDEVLQVSAIVLGASLASLFTGYHYGSKARAARQGVFATYEDSLRQSLNLCLQGDALVDCGQSAVANVLGAAPEVPDLPMNPEAPDFPMNPEAAVTPNVAVTPKVEKSEPKIGAVEHLSRRDTASGLMINTYSYIASPEINFKVVARESSPGVRSDKIVVSVVAKHKGSEFFSGESLLVLIVDGTAKVVTPEWRVNQLSDGSSLESVSITLSGDEFTALFAAVRTFEFRVEKSGYALPSDALTQLRNFAGSIKK